MISYVKILILDVGLTVVTSSIQLHGIRPGSEGVYVWVLLRKAVL